MIIILRGDLREKRVETRNPPILFPAIPGFDGIRPLGHH